MISESDLRFAAIDIYSTVIKCALYNHYAFTASNISSIFST